MSDRPTPRGFDDVVDSSNAAGDWAREDATADVEARADELRKRTDDDHIAH